MNYSIQNWLYTIVLRIHWCRWVWSEQASRVNQALYTSRMFFFFFLTFKEIFKHRKPTRIATPKLRCWEFARVITPHQLLPTFHPLNKLELQSPITKSWKIVQIVLIILSKSTSLLWQCTGYFELKQFSFHCFW